MIDLLGVGMYVVVDYKYNVAVQVWHVVQVMYNIPTIGIFFVSTPPAKTLCVRESPSPSGPAIFFLTEQAAGRGACYYGAESSRRPSVYLRMAN